MDSRTATDPEDHPYQDFRSSAIPKQRRRKTTTKYYSYRAVHPSWVGKQYYALHLVSSTIHTLKVKPQSSKHDTCPCYIESVIEKDEPALLDTLVRDECDWRLFHTWWLAPQVELAVAQAKSANVESYPLVITNPESTHPQNNDWLTSNDPSNPLSIQRVPIEPPGSYPPTMPDNLHLKLAVRTWTKKDNYHNATNFWWGADRRHHRGKRSFREKRLQKWNERELGRNQRARTEQARWAADRDDEWMLSPYEEWTDRMCWEHGVCNYELAYSYYWLTDEDYKVNEEECRCGDDGHRAADIFGALDRILLWREAQRECEVVMAECERKGEDDDDCISIRSGIIVLRRFVDFDSDIDVMSDLAEVIMEGEWDVLSDTSDLYEDFVLIE